MAESFVLEVTDDQVASADYVELDGLVAHTLLSKHLFGGRPATTELARVLRERVDDASLAALEVMYDGPSTFAPGFAIPDHVDRDGDHSASESIADADHSSLQRLVTRVYGAEVPARWQRVLDDPRRWLHDVARAHRGIADVVHQLKHRRHSERAAEQHRFELARDSRETLAVHLAADSVFRLGATGISMPWAHSLTLAFQRHLRFAPLLLPGTKLVLLRDSEDGTDVDAVVAYGPARAPIVPTTAAASRLELLLGVGRARILQGTAVPITVGTLARNLHYAPATVSYHVGLLETIGLVEIHRDGTRTRVHRTLRGDMLIASLM